MTALTTRPTFSLAPRSLDEAMRFADMIAGTNMVPQAYKNKPGDILVAVQMGAEIGLSPMQALQGISVINGKPAVWGDAAMALVRGHPACEAVSEGVDGDGEKRAGWCEVKRRGQPAQRRTFSVADAKKAGLWGKPGPWQQYPDRMLQLRARGFAIRDVFPDALRGVITVEEAQDYPTATVVGFGATSHTEAISDARDQMLAMGMSYRVTFPNGNTRDYGDKAKAWTAIAIAAQRCEDLACINKLADDNAGLLETAPGEEVPEGLQDLRDLLSAMREGLARAVEIDVSEIDATANSATDDAPHPFVQPAAEDFAKDRAAAIAAAKTLAELDEAMKGEGWAALPEKWRNELYARAAGLRANLELKETLV